MLRSPWVITASVELSCGPCPSFLFRTWRGGEEEPPLAALLALRVQLGSFERTYCVLGPTPYSSVTKAAPWSCFLVGKSCTTDPSCTANWASLVFRVLISSHPQIGILRQASRGWWIGLSAGRGSLLCCVHDLGGEASALRVWLSSVFLHKGWDGKNEVQRHRGRDPVGP